MTTAWLRHWLFVQTKKQIMMRIDHKRRSFTVMFCNVDDEEEEVDDEEKQEEDESVTV